MWKTAEVCCVDYYNLRLWGVEWKRDARTFGVVFCVCNECSMNLIEVAALAAYINWDRWCVCLSLSFLPTFSSI